MYSETPTSLPARALVTALLLAIGTLAGPAQAQKADPPRPPQPAGVEVETVIEGPDSASLVTVRDSIEMAVIARRLGLIDELTVEEVMTEIDARL